MIFPVPESLLALSFYLALLQGGNVDAKRRWRHLTTSKGVAGSLSFATLKARVSAECRDPIASSSCSASEV